MKKNHIALLLVVFVLSGVGIVYAGKGVCKTPDPDITVTQTRQDYPSGRPMKIAIINGVVHGHQSCVGEEGNCSTTLDVNAVKGYLTEDWWTYNDTSDDDAQLEDSGRYSHYWYVRVICD